MAGTDILNPFEQHEGRTISAEVKKKGGKINCEEERGNNARP
jgi:hypothetical protein